jgi:hypothetical protein
LMLKSSGAGTTMNGLAAPDVRAPSVRGRWHFGPLLARFPHLVMFRRLGITGGCGYTLAP